MKLSSTLNQRSSSWITFLICLLSATLIFTNSYAQTKNYATTATVKATTVDNATNATNGTNSFATVKSRGGVIGFGKYSGELELTFPTVLPANTTSYIRLDFDADILNALLGGNLGGFLADVLGSLVLGNHVFEVGARSTTGATVLFGRSSENFDNANLKLIKDGEGLYYIAITPNQPYDRVYVKDITNAAVIGGINETKVYNAFYYSGNETCANGFATSYEGSGLTVDVIGVGKAGVTNAERAIDADQTNFSEISLGALGVAGSISQNIYFSTLSNPSDEFNIRLRINPALISAGVLDNTVISAYNGDTEVFSENMNSLISLDLLGLLNGGQITTVPFLSALPFNRVKITLNSLLNAGITQTVSLYSVFSSAARPTFTSPMSGTVQICYNTAATLSATTATTNELRWYEILDGGTALATTAYNASFVSPALTANKTYYVAARRIGCTAESIRIPIAVVVNPAIVFTTTTLLNAAVGSAYSKQITTATGGTPTYTYALSAGSSLPSGLILSSNGQIGGTPTVAGDYNFNITVTDSKNCTSTANYSLKVTPTLVLSSAAMPNGTVGVLYPTQIIPLATGGTTPYTYVATNLPPGLTFDPATREITGTPTTSGTYVVNIVATDADGNQASNNYTIAVKDALVLSTAPLTDGTVGLTYQTQTILAATGGTGPYTYTAADLPPGLTFDPATREIMGTPTSAGTYIIPVTVVDAEGRTKTSNYSISVKEPLSLANQPLPDGTVNVVYPTQILPAATGGTGPYTYAATNLPIGLSFDADTREIKGTPTQAGNYTITLTATDAELKTISNTYALKVIGALSLPTANLPNGAVGVAYPSQILPEVSGGTAPYTYVATNLPPGLSFNPATREIIGSPTQGGVYTIAVTANDANGNVITTDYNITINVSQPLVNGATVCSGTTAVLTVTNLQAGVTYNWYGATGSTPLVSGNNGTFTTPVVTATTTFYVEAVSGTAVSSRTAVTVNINPAPNAPVITTNNQVINSGQNTVLQATANTGETIKWYATAAGGTALASGPSFTTPNLTTTTTYYAEAVNGNLCVSANRSAVNVTVLNGVANPNCNAANSQNSGISGVCIGCSITDAGHSTDADFNNYTRITLAVGVGAQGYQRLIFPSTGLATDSIRLDLATPTGLLDLSVLSGVTVTVMNAGAIVNTYQLNSALIDLKLLSGNRFRATVLAGGAYDRVEVRFGATVAALSSIDIYGAEIIYPKPTVAINGLAICSGNTTTLTATPNGGTTLTWYSDAVGGSILANGNTYTTPTLTTTTTYYIQVSKAGCALTERVPVTVTVTPVIAVPVVVAAVTSCEGATSTLSVSNPDPAITYNWFENPVGGSSIFTGATFTTPALTANKTYYVEASQSGCVSATRAAVNVTVNPRPAAPQVQASSATINQGQTVVLTASATDANVNFNWYNSLTATTPIFTGATYVTPPLTATTSYFVESFNTVTGCTSSTRVQLTITVQTGGSTNPVPCEAALSQTNGVSGVLTLLAGVSNPNLAIDNDTQTGSTLLIPVGLAGSVYQRLTFPSASNVGDTIKILINSPSKLLSASVLGSLQLTTYNTGVSNNDAVFSNDPLINLTLLSGNSQALLTFIPTSPFNEVEVRLNSGLVGALTSLNVNYAQHLITKPEVVATNVAVCIAQSTTLSVNNPKAGITYKWYDAAGVYQTGKDGVSFITPAIPANTKYFVSASSTSGCESAKIEINITTTDLPLVPELLFANVNTCPGNNVVLEVKNPIVGVTYKWYNAGGIYQVGKDGVSLIVNAVIANTSFSVEAESACGTSAKATATITVGTIDVPIVTPPAVTVTEGSPAILTASSSSSGAIFNWYASVGSPIILYTGATYVTPPLTNTTTYFVEAVAPGLCPASGRASVEVTVIPNGIPIATPCGAATIALADGVTGVALLAGVANPGLAIDNDIQTGSSLLIPIGALGASVYQRVGFAGGLSHIGDTLRVKLSSPGKLLSLAVLPSLSVTTYNGATSNNDAVLVNDPLIHLELLSDNSAVILSYVPTQPFDGVEVRLNSGLLGALTDVNFNYAQRINVAPQVTAATASACQGSSATLSVLNPKAGVIYKWYLDNVHQADGVTFATPTSLTAGSHNFTVTASAFGCESVSTKVVVTIIAAPVPPIAVPTNPTQACIGNLITLSVQQVAGVNFNWYNSTGDLLAINNASYTPSTSVAGSFDFFVEAVNGNNCANATRTKITLNINPLAKATDIQIAGTVAICGSSTTTLTASSSTLTNPVFTWYSNAALTNVVFVGEIFTTPILSANTSYYVTVSGANKCANSSADAKIVSIIINPIATTTDISLAGVSTVCSGSPVALTASSTTVTNPVFTWYRNSTLTDVAFIGAVFTTPALTVNTTFYVTVKGTNKCENTAGNALAVPITVNPIAQSTDLVISGNTTVCSGSTASLTASSTTVTNPVFTWYNDANLTTVAFVGATFTSPVLTTSKTYYVTVKGDNKCESSSANAKIVTVTVNEYATAADITLTIPDPVCGNGIVAIQASSLTVSNPVFTWYSDASLTNAVFVGSSFNTPNLTITTTYYVTVKGTNICENIANNAKQVTIVVKPIAIATDITVTGNSSFCEGNATVLTASSTTVINPVFTWYSEAALTNAVFVGSSFTTPILNVNTTYYVTVKGDNRCENTVTNTRTIGITVNAKPVNPVIANTGRNICSGTATTLTVTNPTAGVIYEWYSAVINGTPIFTGNTYVTPVLNANTTYYVQAISSAGCTNAGGRVIVDVNVTPLPATPIVATNNISVCSGNTVVLTVTNPVVGVTYTWYTAAVGGAVVGTGANLTTPIISSNVTYFVEAAAGSCQSTARTPVAITVMPIPLAPVAVTSANNPICGGSTSILTVNNPDANLIYRWYSSSSGGTMLFEGTSFTTPVLNTTTIYYVESIAKSGGCASNSRTSITVTVLPTLSAPMVIVQSTTSTSVNFAWNTVAGASSYELSINNGTTWIIPSSGSNGTTHAIQGLQPGQSVTLIVRAKGTISCQTSANSVATTGTSENPFANDLFIPNTFTPNGDGKNDVFLAYGNLVSKFKMRIYNQWGEQLSESNTLTAGWDGRWKGNIQPSGVYVYYIDVTFNDGTSKMFKGTVTLLK